MTSMYQMYVTLHARDHQVAPGTEIELAGTSLRTLVVPPSALGTPFETSFEAVEQELKRFPRMFFEPDGSFVWVSSASEPAWQLDGVVYDRDGRLLYVDLKGKCPTSEFDRLLRAVGWPDTQVMFQLVRQAVFLDEEEFRRFGAMAIL